MTFGFWFKENLLEEINPDSVLRGGETASTGLKAAVVCAAAHLLVVFLQAMRGYFSCER